MGTGYSIRYLKVLLNMNGPDTQTSKSEQAAIKKYCTNKAKAIEIGVFEGYNTALIAESLQPTGKVFGVDPFIKGRFGISFGKKIAETNLKRRKLDSKAVLVEKLSGDALNDVPDNVDFIFIDGDHSFEGVKTDLELYESKLAPEGVMAFHDARVFTNGWAQNDWGPVRLVQEVIIPSQKWTIVEEVDSLVVIKRKK